MMGFLLGLLGIVFIYLKLTGVLLWSWWYVTMPFWGGLAAALILIVSVIVATFLMSWFFR